MVMYNEISKVAILVIISCYLSLATPAPELLYQDLLFASADNHTLTRKFREAALNHNIRFDVPDLNIQHSVNGRDVELHAYKVRDRDNQWVSIGQPYFLTNGNSSIYEFTPESINMRLRLLANDQRGALKKVASDFYPHINQAFITLIPLQSLTCKTSFTMRGEIIEMQGKAYNLNEYEVPIEIICEENSKERKAFYERIKRADSLNWKCTFAAAGKQQFVNRLHISGEDLQDAVIDHDLFGPSDQVYVTRKQLTLFAQKVRSNLLIEEDYDLDEKFDEKVIDRLLSLASRSFEFVPIDQALEKLSKFGFSMSERDLEPDEIKRKLADTMTIEKLDTKTSTSEKNDDKRMTEDDNEDNTKADAKLSLSALFDMEANADVLKKKRRKENVENMSAKDQIDEINKDNQIHVKFEVEGSKIEPKYVKVALLHKNGFRRDVSISYRKKIWKDSLYKKEITVTTAYYTKAISLEQQITDKIRMFETQWSMMEFAVNDKIEKELKQYYSTQKSLFNDANVKLKDQLANVTSTLEKSYSQVRNSVSALENSRDQLNDRLKRQEGRQKIGYQGLTPTGAKWTRSGVERYFCCPDDQFIYGVHFSPNSYEVHTVFCASLTLL